jgi:P63C domain
MTDEKATTMAIQSMGGRARAESLSPSKRTEIAKKAAASRWGANLPQASHDGPLQIGDAVLTAAVLPNGKRLISQTTLLIAIGRHPKPKAGTGVYTVDGLPSFLQADALKPFITEELLQSTTPITFKLRNGQVTAGYDAMLLPLSCEVYLNLRDKINADLADADPAAKGMAKKHLGQYKRIIEACDRLTRGLAKRGIIGLVDDATGYQDDKVRQDIQRIIQMYVAPALVPWVQKFPHQFFKEAYRILGWDYKPGQTKHSPYMGKFINKYVFEALPPGVLDELKRQLPKNERGNRRAKLWQLLTVDTGIPHLDRQLTADITVMQLSEDKRQFEENWDKLFGKQRLLPLAIPKELTAGY